MKTFEEKISIIQECADNTDGNIVMLSSVYSCLSDAKKCMGRIENPGEGYTSEDWTKAINEWIEKAAQYCWGFNRPKNW